MSDPSTKPSARRADAGGVAPSSKTLESKAPDSKTLKDASAPDAGGPAKKPPFAVYGAAAAALVASLGAYGAGRLQTSGRIDEAEAKEAAATKDKERAVADLAIALEVARDYTKKLEARRRVDLAVLALDERNFGTAQEHVAAAVALLKKTQAVTDPAHELAKLRGELEAFRLMATEEVGDQRKKLLGFAKRFDELHPPPKPE